MSATSTGKTDQKKAAYATAWEAMEAADMTMPTDPELIPEDDNWHTVIVERPTGYQIEVAFYHPERHIWTLGTDKPCRPISICGYDKACRTKSSRGKSIQDDEGALRLAERILSDWRKEYKWALASYRHKRTKEKLQQIESLERQFPSWLLPAGATKKDVISTLRKDAGL